MAKLHNPVGLLLTVLLLLQGTGGDSNTVFSSAGGTATLPCHSYQHYQSCSSATTWASKGYRGNAVFTFEKNRPDNTPRSERLSLLPNCSLHITDVTTKDAGQYTCQPYQNGGSQYGPNAPVHLSVLSVNQEVSKRETGSDVSLHCSLATYGGCERLVHLKNVRLNWVDEGGAELQNTTSLEIRRESTCHITLTEKLRAPNPVHTQRTRKCQLTAEGQVQTSVSHTVKVPVNPSRTPEPPPAPAPTTISTMKPTWPPDPSHSSTIKPTWPPDPSHSSTIKPTWPPDPSHSSTIKPTWFPGPPHSSGVPLMAGVGVSVGLLAAVLMIIVVMHKRKSKVGGEPKLNSTYTGNVISRRFPIVTNQQTSLFHIVHDAKFNNNIQLACGIGLWQLLIRSMLYPRSVNALYSTVQHVLPQRPIENQACLLHSRLRNTTIHNWLVAVNNKPPDLAINKIMIFASSEVFFQTKNTDISRLRGT
ncbi:uncharacterized protein LOC143109378 isoform X2 [Alosa pseudoharengus]|uniref:uncharacterized protein LOC143109378 isoform X2 n=1 Tax=Alosa pseudoharengus TaxID=34774 RepID=UPI003F8C3A53